MKSQTVRTSEGKCHRRSCSGNFEPNAVLRMGRLRPGEGLSIVDHRAGKFWTAFYPLSLTPLSHQWEGQGILLGP